MAKYETNSTERKLLGRLRETSMRFEDVALERVRAIGRADEVKVFSDRPLLTQYNFIVDPYVFETNLRPLNPTIGVEDKITHLYSHEGFCFSSFPRYELQGTWWERNFGDAEELMVGEELKEFRRLNYGEDGTIVLLRPNTIVYPVYEGEFETVQEMLDLKEA